MCTLLPATRRGTSSDNRQPSTQSHGELLAAPSCPPPWFPQHSTPALQLARATCFRFQQVASAACPAVLAKLPLFQLDTWRSDDWHQTLVLLQVEQAAPQMHRHLAQPAVPICANLTWLCLLRRIGDAAAAGRFRGPRRRIGGAAAAGRFKGPSPHLAITQARNTRKSCLCRGCLWRGLWLAPSFAMTPCRPQIPQLSQHPNMDAKTL